MLFLVMDVGIFVPNYVKFVHCFSSFFLILCFELFLDRVNIVVEDSHNSEFLIKINFCPYLYMFKQGNVAPFISSQLA